MNKKNLKSGHSLIELLAVTVIIAIVITIVTISVTSKINTSKETGNKLTEENIIDTSLVYIKEFENTLENWKYEYDENVQPDTNQKYYCITVGELINKGYFDNNILNDNIKIDTYVKITKNDSNKTYITSDLITPQSTMNMNSICDKYTVTFVDKEGEIIKINDKYQQITVDSGYRLTSSDFPNITSNLEYYSFEEGNSRFVYSGRWEDEFGNTIDSKYVVKRDIVIGIKYSLESGSGDAYLLKKGQQRPFAGESDEDIRYNKGADIVLTDNNGTSLADFVLNCPNTSNCVLTLDNQEIGNFLTLETKNTLSNLGLINNIDWYVLKYVNGTWHLDGQIRSDFTIGFINLSRLDNNIYANCKYINNNSTCNYSDGYNLAITTYNDNSSLTSLTITYTDNTTAEYNLTNLTKEDNKNIFSTQSGYYTNSKISKTKVQNINSVTIKYQQNDEEKQATYKYSYNGGIYIFELQ